MGCLGTEHQHNEARGPLPQFCPFYFISTMLWGANGFLFLPKATDALEGDPSHRASSCRVPLLAPLPCLCRHPGVVTAPTLARPRVFQSATLLFSLDSAHTFINSLFVKFASVSLFGIAICFLWDPTDTILDYLISI